MSEHEPPLSWILNHLGEDRAAQRGAVAPVIHQTSNFAFPTVAGMRSALRDELEHSFYTRGNNPTQELLRAKLAALDGAEDALVFASGAAAIAAAVLAVVRAGDHVVAVQKPYAWTRQLLAEHLTRFGVAVDFVDARAIENVAAALAPNTKLIVLESPNSMTFELQDLGAIAALARPRGITTLVDNSWASPLLQRPLELGIDLVAYSLTKYAAGHSDVVAGAVCGARALIRRIFRGPLMTLGAVLAPHDAWLVLRGLRTLGVRMERIQRTTAQVVEFLAGHPKIERVLYPGSADFPQRDLAARQQSGSSGLFSILLRAADVAAVERFCDALEHFLLACSWGGYESLAFPVACTLDPGRPPPGALPFNLVRLSIGLEEPETLIADLERALARL